MERFVLHSTDATGVEVDSAIEGGGYRRIDIDWHTLRDAAAQPDEELASIYSGLLRRAEEMERSRLLRTDWQMYGYPLLAGFGHQYAGQAVRRAWEIRRVRHGGKDVRVAYIIEWGLETPYGVISRSGEMPDVESARDWLRHNYGAWHDESWGERGARIWAH